MNEAVFLDTSGWLALLNAHDSLHLEASRVWVEVAVGGGAVVTTDWVVAETGNGLARFPGRSRFAQAVDRLRSSPRGRLTIIDTHRLERALTLYDNRPDKPWGLVDCASFVVMAELGIRDAFTADHHYEQAGFRRLLSVT